MKILIVEDEKDLALDIEKYLSSESYRCERADSFDAAMEKIQTHTYDCILLDLMLPGGNGLTILKELKNQHKLDGVIILSAKNSFDDKIEGLQLGADDYLPKPFHHAELLARIQAIIRRKQFDSNNIIEIGDLTIDIPAQTAQIKGHSLSLTKKEFQLLLFFIGNKNKVLSKATIAEHLSGDFADMFDNHDFIYAHVKNLKRKLKENGFDDALKTVYGTGYKWES